MSPVKAQHSVTYTDNNCRTVVAQSAPWSNGGLDSNINKFFNLPALRSIDTTDPLFMYIHQLKGFEQIPLASYAVVQSQHGCRIKTLALGIPYQVNFNYRRELLGHFLLTRRCIACLELPLAAGTQVRPEEVWQDVGGMNMCPTCFSKYTVRNDKLISVPGLLKHLSQITPQSGKLGPWLPERCRPWTGQGVHWRPLVDDFTRQKCGLDSEMLLAKQEYFDWLRDTLRGQTSTVYHGRQTIRWDVIRIAQGYWSKPWPDEVPFVPPPNIQDLRNTVIPIHRLADFLFRPEKLDRNALSPQNLEGQWPDDPADIIRYQRDIPARTEQWKERKAKLMLCTCSPLRCMTYAFVLASSLQLSHNFCRSTRHAAPQSTDGVCPGGIPHVPLERRAHNHRHHGKSRCCRPYNGLESVHDQVVPGHQPRLHQRGGVDRWGRVGGADGPGSPCASQYWLFGGRLPC